MTQNKTTADLMNESLQKAQQVQRERELSTIIKALQERISLLETKVEQLMSKGAKR